MTISADCIAPNGSVTIIHIDGSGDATGFAICAADAAPTHIENVPGAAALTISQAAQLDGTMNWHYANSVLTATTPAAPPLATLQAAAYSQIDAAAEATRLLWITPGAGQAMEYMQTQTEANAASAAADPLDPAQYPMLAAELAANVAAGNTSITLRQIAQAASAQIAAWQSTGVSIKQVRMAAKLQIAAATTGAAIDAIVAGVAWPTPGT